MFYTDAPEAIKLVQSAFPEYHHAPCRLRVQRFAGPIRPDSYWAGGSRDLWAFVRLSDFKASSALPESGSGFSPDSKEIELLPQGYALVKYTIGSHKCALVYLNPENITPLLPPSDSLTSDEEVVLTCTARFKSSHRREYAFRKWRISLDNPCHVSRWNSAVESLKAKRLLNSSGAVTTAGRNRAGDYYALPSEFAN